jgi:hypothetical protein
MGWLLDRIPPKTIGILAPYGIGLILAALIGAGSGCSAIGGVTIPAASTLGLRLSPKKIF